MTLTAFITMAAGVMALFHYKRQWELGCFLLYLAVLSGWGLLVMLAPSGGPLALKLFQGLFFPFAVLAPVLLSMALTGVGRPTSRHQMRFALPPASAAAGRVIPLGGDTFYRPDRRYVLLCGTSEQGAGTAGRRCRAAPDAVCHHSGAAGMDLAAWAASPIFL